MKQHSLAHPYLKAAQKAKGMMTLIPLITSWQPPSVISAISDLSAPEDCE